MEIINTPGYDPESVREAQRQIIRQLIIQGLPRFPTGLMKNVFQTVQRKI